MFTPSNILSCLSALVGWQPSLNPCTSSISPEVAGSSEGLYYSDAHPLLTIENLEAIAPNFEAYAYPVWDVASTYNTGDIVKYNDVFYISLTDSNTGNTPDSDPINWEEKRFFSDWLEDKTQAYILQFVNAIFAKKAINKEVKSLFDDRYIFTGSGRMTDLIVKQGRFVGFEIKPMPQEDIKATINKLGFQFSQLQSGLNIYIYHTSQVEPIFVEPITTTKAFSFEWVALSQKLDLFFASDSYDTGGCFYLGYYEDDLSGQAIKKNYNFSRPCTTCTGSGDYHFWRTWSKFFKLSPIAFRASALNGTDLPDIDMIEYHSSNNFGMNLNVSAHCDLSAFLCRQGRILAFPMQKWVGLKMVEEIANTLRLNRDKSEAQKLAILSLDDASGTTTLKQEVSALMKQINFDLSNLNTVCLPCSEPSGIKYGSV